MNKTSKEENLKQGSEYLSKIYSLDRRPITKYPSQLAKFLFSNYMQDINKEDIKLLDLGCGRGDMLRAFKNLGLNVFGADLSKESVKLNKPIKITQLDIEKDRIPKVFINQFDIVFSKSLIEHLREPMKFFINAKKILKKNGILIVMTPSWVHHKFGPFYLDFTHVTPFTLQSLRDIAVLNNLQVIKVDYFYQLPIVWKYNYFKLFSKIVSFLKIPYQPMYENLTKIKWPNYINTFLRHSNEVMLIGVFKK